MAEPIRYYFDQHFPVAVALGLRHRGLDVLTAQEAGRCGLSDPEQLAFAAADERVLGTFDTDFLALHAAGVPHAGISWCTATKYGIGQLVHLLLLLHAVSDRDEMKNRVEHL